MPRRPAQGGDLGCGPGCRDAAAPGAGHEGGPPHLPLRRQEQHGRDEQDPQTDRWGNAVP